MYFNSVTYAVFLLIVFVVYWLLKNGSLHLQNLFLLGCSYFFYGCWDWRFLSLIVISSATDFFVGKHISQSPSESLRKFLLALSIFLNLGILFTFKYFDFFAQSFQQILQQIGLQTDIHSLQIILPVGISFYTFQTLSYTIDIYKRKAEATDDAIAFFAFVAFFPQLVAGPIERASNLLPQFFKKRTYQASQVHDGLRQILWGLLKKTVIADNMAGYVERAFNCHADLDSLSLIVGAMCFALQIYCDFSGYSDIAIGSAKMLGFSLMRNFNNPYFSSNLVDFWRRWHISLSTWFRDYVYIPLGGSKVSRARWVANGMVTFVASGLWHGANWTFVSWGAIHGALYILTRACQIRLANNIFQLNKFWRYILHPVSILTTFGLVTLAWVFFRAGSLHQALSYLDSIATGGWSGFIVTGLPFLARSSILLFSVEFINRKRSHGLEISYLPTWCRWCIYYMIVVLIMQFGFLGHSPFIYFQF